METRMSEMTQTSMTASHDARAQMTGITKGARVVFPVTVGGLGRENHRTIYREGTVVSTWREDATERARIREASDHYASGRGYVPRLVPLLLPAGSSDAQQRLAEATFTGPQSRSQHARPPP